MLAFECLCVVSPSGYLQGELKQETAALGKVARSIVPSHLDSSNNTQVHTSTAFGPLHKTTTQNNVNPTLQLRLRITQRSLLPQQLPLDLPRLLPH